MPTFFLLLCVCHFFLSISGTKRPILTQVIFRHGERFPLYYDTFPTDSPEIRKQIVTGRGNKGELTNNGIRQGYQLGQHLLSLYGDLLHTPFKPSQLRVTAGKDNRTLDTASAAVAGLLSMEGRTENWNPYLNWRPVAVHMNQLLDWSSFGTLVNCSPFNESVVASNRYGDLMKKYANTMEYLQKVTGVNIDSIYGLFKIAEGLMLRIQLLGRPMLGRPWDDGTFYLDFYKDTSQVLFYSDPQTLRFTGGWLFLQIINAIESRILENSNHRLVLYSGHDHNINALGQMLNVSRVKEVPPGFAAYLVVELYNRTNGYEVELKYASHVNEKAKKVTVEGCGPPCGYETFITMAPTISETEIYGFCYSDDMEQNVKKYQSLSITLLILASLMLFLLLMATCCLRCFYQRQLKQRRV